MRLAFDKDVITTKEMREAIKRSGYLLEQRAKTLLQRAGFSIEINSSYPDPKEGKSREFDIWAAKGRPIFPGELSQWEPYWFANARITHCLSFSSRVTFQRNIRGDSARISSARAFRSSFGFMRRIDTCPSTSASQDFTIACLAHFLRSTAIFNARIRRTNNGRPRMTVPSTIHSRQSLTPSRHASTCTLG